MKEWTMLKDDARAWLTSARLLGGRKIASTKAGPTAVVVNAQREISTEYGAPFGPQYRFARGLLW